MFYDYFSILNIKPTASKSEIKKAYYKQAMIWHPDKNKSLNATEHMQLINEAYLILNDDEARIKYLVEYNKHFLTSNYREVIITNSENDIFDKKLKKWIKNARIQAINLNNLSFEEITGTVKSAIWAFSKGVIYAIIGLFFSILFLLA